MASKSPYRFCTPDQQAVAIKARILDFLEGDKLLLDELKNLTQELSYKFAVFWDGEDRAKLSLIMSHVFGTTPSPNLKDKFIAHLLRVQVDGSISVYLDALGPIVVALTL